MEIVMVPDYWWMDKENVILVYTMEFYLSTKNKILSFAGKWLELKNILLSEVSQVQKAKSHVFSFICEI
jgi:hypothetical protein